MCKKQWQSGGHAFSAFTDVFPAKIGGGGSLGCIVVVVVVGRYHKNIKRYRRKIKKNIIIGETTIDCTTMYKFYNYRCCCCCCFCTTSHDGCPRLWLCAAECWSTGEWRGRESEWRRLERCGAWRRWWWCC